MKRWVASQRGIRWTLGGIAAVGLAPAAARVVFAPAGDWPAPDDGGAARGTLSQTARDTARGRVLAVGAGLLATGALAFTARKYVLSRGGQATGRYAKALEQLGCEQLDVRIDGIYALERVARDSPGDRLAVMELLAAFIRERSREQWPPPDSGGQARERSLRPDVHAAITVVGHRRAEPGIGPADLARADLTRADLAGAELGGARLAGARLAGANLDGADLAGADLTEAVLAHAVLARADLLGAKLVRADLAGADLGGARLTGADLTRANLTDADLTDVDLTDADLTDADLTRAELAGARWPAGGQVPSGWKRHTGSGQLIPAGAGAESFSRRRPELGATPRGPARNTAQVHSKPDVSPAPRRTISGSG